MRIPIAAIQMTSGPDVARNLLRAEALVGEAALKGAKLAVLPENFALMAEHESEKFKHAEEIAKPGPILSAMCALAEARSVALVLGGFPERAALADKVHNTAVYISASGKIEATYRKIHLFDVEIADGASYRESKTVAPGSEPVLVESPAGPLGLSVCYDLRFPELYRRLSDKGARLLSVPAAFTLQTGRDHWHVLIRARAIENLAYVIAAGQVGRHPASRVTFGHSMICDPWGQILAELPDEEGVAVADIDWARQDRLRASLPALQHRRL